MKRTDTTRTDGQEKRHFIAKRSPNIWLDVQSVNKPLTFRDNETTVKYTWNWQFMGSRLRRHTAIEK